MHVLVWRFQVDPAQEHAFERAYGPGGEREALFRRSEGYLATSLFRELGPPSVHLTLDRWRDLADHQSFLERWAAQYEELDRRCRTLVLNEEYLGSFESTSEAGAGPEAEG